VNIELLELAAARLGHLRESVVFVGGATVELWITDPTAPEFRPTDDIDVIVEVSGRTAYLRVEEELQRLGFRHDQEGGVICRFREPDSGLILDVMPTDARILGFSNEWLGKGFAHAASRTLPSGTEIAVLLPTYLLATKLEAFAGRGRGDFLGSRDFADVIALVDGRAELTSEVADAPADLRAYVASELGRLKRSSSFEIGVAAALKPDPSSQERAERVVIPRISELIERGQE
jgi:hypothetical protein